MYFAVTGQNNTGVNVGYTRTKYGRVYRVTLDAADPLKGTLEVILDGDDRSGPAGLFQNPDNIYVGENYVYIQEDDNGYGDEAHDAFIYQYNIATRSLRPVLQLDHRRSQADGARYNARNARPEGNAGWEFGAMIDVSTELGNSNTFLVALQPHSWRGSRYVGVDGGTLRPGEDQASLDGPRERTPALMLEMNAQQAMNGARRPARLVRCLSAGAALPVSACGTGRPDGTIASAAARSPLGREVHGRWVADIDAFLGNVAALDSALVLSVRDSSAATTRQVQARFTAARMAYKRVEFLSTYYEPSTSDAINGPALPHVDDEEGPEAVMPPEGFQVVEELLFPVADRSALTDAINETRNLYAYARRLRTAAAGQQMTDDRIWDAAKLQLARIVSLGITGFDSPVALQSLPEAAAALRGVRDALEAYRSALDPRGWATRTAAFDTAISQLDRNPYFNDFDRLAFITQAANPLARAMDDARVALRISVTSERRAFRTEAASLFDIDAFDVYAFAPLQTMPATTEQVALGRALFFEPKLSGDGTVACATCHDPDHAFTDGRARSVARSGKASLRNAPTIINAGLQVGSFYDLRTTYLEDQVSDVVRNDEEMHGSVEQAAVAFKSDAQYRARFASAFPRSAESAASGTNVRLAIAAYIRSLTALDSRVDRALRGDTTAIDAEERQGLNLFLGKARCGTCHFAPLFNGTVPPQYQESEVEVIGVPARRATRNARIDPDSGRMRVTRSVPHRYAFKTPSVRNAALTAPYMHNGAYPTLSSVVDFYNRGGGVGIGIRLEHQTLPADTLGLSTAEQRALVRFMGALTDTARVTSSPEATAYRRGVAQRALAVHQ